MDNGAATRQSQVNEQIDGLERAMKRYEDLLTQAEARFETVLRKEPELKGTGESPKPDVPLAPLADRLRVMTRTFNILSTRLESLIARAEN